MTTVPFLLAQLSAEDAGVVKLAIGVVGTLFAGLVTWVAAYMSSKSKKVDELDKDVSKHELRLGSIEEWRGEARPILHKVGNLEQRIAFLEKRLEDLECTKP